MPTPQGNATVLNTAADPSHIQVLYLWEQDNVPSVGNMDSDWLAEGELPPTFYVYGAEDPFYRQFEQQYSVVQNMGIHTGRIVLDGWSHGFGLGEETVAEGWIDHAVDFWQKNAQM